MNIELCILLVIPPDRDIYEIKAVLCGSYQEAKNRIEYYRQYEEYKNYKFVVHIDDVDIDITLR